MSARGGFVESVRLLVLAGADVNATCGDMVSEICDGQCSCRGNVCIEKECFRIAMLVLA